MIRPAFGHRGVGDGARAPEMPESVLAGPGAGAQPSALAVFGVIPMPRKPVDPPVYLAGALVLMILLHLVAPLAKWIAFPECLVGLFPLALGAGLNVWASEAFRKAKTTVKPAERSSRLVTHGAFRFMRHPMYVGMVLVLVGTAILLGSVSPWFVIVPFIGVMRFFMVREEEQLETVFEGEYRDYRQRVRRWL